MTSGKPTSLQGRKSQFAASVSSRWLNIVVDLQASLSTPPPSNVKFRGTTDSRLKDWPTSGIGARRPSTRKCDRPQPVFCGRLLPLGVSGRFVAVLGREPLRERRLPLWPS